MISASISVYAEVSPEEQQTITEVSKTSEEQNTAAEQEANSTGVKAISAAATIALGAVAAAIAMGISISKASESIARQPEAEGSIRTNLLLGLVFIETTVIYALVVSIIIIFVM